MSTVRQEIQPYFFVSHGMQLYNTGCVFAVSSLREKLVTGIMQLVITSKRKRWVFGVLYD